MEREYDIFEQMPDGFPIWRAHASGLQAASLKLQEIAKETPNECFVVYLPTKEVVARLNSRPRTAASKKLIFHIAYTKEQAVARTQILRMCGIEVISVIGNESAKVILNLRQHCDLFIIGNAGADQDRSQMVAWLRSHYPAVRILALNAPGIQELAGADYNVNSNGPETWLPMVTRAFGTT